MTRPVLFPITYQCNLDCVYCSEKHKKGLNIDIEKSIETILKKDNDWVFITGGEPLLVPNIVDICKRLKAARKKVGLTTNGTIHRFEVLNHIDRIGVSLDGDEDRTDRNRGKGTFSKAIAFLEEAVKIETVIMATTEKRLPEQEKFLEDLGERLGVKYLQVTLC
jgi:MoaA/NifB/PqqE/SkfB family radical SAM enzyme